MQDFFWNLDVTIFRFINQTLSFDGLNQITPWLTDLSHFTWFKIAAPLILIFCFYKKFKRIGITYFLFFILSVSTSDFTGGKVKKIILRPRPFQVTETQAIQRAQAAEDRSFYSNHTSNMFTAASYLSVFFPAAQIALYTAAVVIAFTRVHVGVHYPSDVLFGAMMGVIWGLSFNWLVQKIVRKSKSVRSKPL